MFLFILNIFFLTFINPTLKSPKDFTWENRILIIRSGDSNTDWFDEKIEQDLKTRKLLVFQFEGETLVKTNCQEKVDASKFLEKLATKNSQLNHWVLIGLDGGVKNLGSNPPNPLQIFKIIDAMPMRQSEIRIL